MNAETAMEIGQGMSGNTFLTPLQKDVYLRLLKYIGDNSLNEGDKLPSFKDVAEELGISLKILQTVIPLMSKDGVVKTVPYVGTFVTRKKRMEAEKVKTVENRKGKRIAMILPLAIRGYHPFFSELLRGIREGIDAIEYSVHELNFSNQLVLHDDIKAVPWSENDTIRDLYACEDLSGVICGASIAGRLRADLPGSIPIVAADETDTVPYVAYDWNAELDHAVMRQISEGAHSIWVYGGALDWRPKSLPDGVTVHTTPGVQQDRGLLSSHVRHAFEEAEKFFTSGSEIDGVVVASDFATQGVLDAAVKCGVKVPGRVRFTCIVNRESRLVYPFPLTMQVADGYLKGRRLVDLLKQHILSQSNGLKRVILRCDEEYYG